MKKRSVKEKQRDLGESKRRSSSINDLPDPLLCHILSYLPTKDSVRSSVLSKRWKNLWLQVPVFDLVSTHFENDFDFMDFVDKFLGPDQKLDLKSFKLIYYFEDLLADDSFFQSWMDTVIRRRVRHLDVQIESDDNELVCMPMSLYSSKTLVSLSLFHVILPSPEPESVVSLPCLKVMHLESIRYDTGSLEALITRSPVLEKLSIVRDPFDYLEVVLVRSQSLKSFALEIERFGDRPVDDFAVEIDAPRLEQMSLHDYLSRSFIVHSIGPSAVVDIDVDFDVEHGGALDLDDDSSERAMVRNFFVGISTVSGLRISSATLEVIQDYPKFEPLPQFLNLSWLYASVLDTSWEMLPTFLGCCPNLHTLFLELESLTEAEPLKLSYVPPCFVSSLKFVQLCTPVTKKSSGQMKLATYFLRNYAVLRELTLSESFGNIFKKIKKTPRKSRGCEIVMD